MTSKNFFLIGFFFAIFSCGRSVRYPANFQNQPPECPDLEDGLSGVSEDPTYGFAMENAVRVGGGTSENELKYLQMLLGPKKEFIDGFFKAGNFWGNGLTLSGYRAIINGDTLTRILYIDTHHCRDPKAPAGFNYKTEYREIKSKDESRDRAYEVPKRFDPK